MTSQLKVVQGGKAPAKPGGVRKENARKRRQALAEVVMQLVKERGFHAISVNEVAERASLSVGGLYRHIDTKNDLLEMVCDEINLDLLRDMKAAAASVRGVRAKLEGAIRTYWLRHWNNAALILLAYREYQSFSDDAKARYRADELAISEYLSDLIRAGVLTEEFREVDDRLLAHEIIMLSHMRALKGYAFKGRTPEHCLQEMVDLIFSRLGGGRA
ncbi:TetR/AcrR family transcriptional regulator [Sphingomonas sp. CL5.1]|uniref:TetR/AcrR family transcriptional regulator n=1 Tax=Sphingomonas sp. CL5.1 TaxID=2653203 RepID=UPI001C2E78FC|nr:TetR/AcrR family transcriptional regulator [Sphingomonas sp. CL5.1]